MDQREHPNLPVERLNQLHVYSSYIDDINELYRYLSASGRETTWEKLQVAMAKGLIMFVLREDNHIVAMASLCTYHTARGTMAIIEDVAVTKPGRRWGALLLAAAVAEAKCQLVDKLRLTSRPDRIAANAMYLNLGFTQRNTNVWDYPEAKLQQ